MAGHSKFKNIQFRKGAQDKKRSKLFSKLAREITAAAKMGLPDPAMNPRLRTAVTAARAQNMPKDNIERAVKKSQEAGGANYEEVRYEGFGAGGVGVIVEALTDNRNRTAAEVRTAFGKHGGVMGESNSVAFNFQRVGLISYPGTAGTAERVFEAALDAGANDVESFEDGHEVYCDVEALADVREKLEATLGEPSGARLTWRPMARVEVADDAAETLFKLIDVLEDNDDVQNVVANFDVSDEALARYEA